MKIYIDSDFKCHLTNEDNNMTEIETSFFNNKCDKFIEGYRYIPLEEVWTREDGEKFTGIMVSPWRDYTVLVEFQEQYEKILNEAQEAYENGVNAI